MCRQLFHQYIYIERWHNFQMQCFTLCYKAGWIGSQGVIRATFPALALKRNTIEAFLTRLAALRNCKKHDKSFHKCIGTDAGQSCCAQVDDRNFEMATSKLLYWDNFFELPTKGMQVRPRKGQVTPLRWYCDDLNDWS